MLCLSMSVNMMAQEKVKQKEVGLVFGNLNNFGLTYRTGTTKSLWRFNTLIIKGNNQESKADSLVTKQSSMGFGLSIGREWRKIIVEKLEFRFGADLAFDFNSSKTEIDDKAVLDRDELDKRTTYSPGVNLVFGLNYQLNNNFIIGAELLPTFRYVTGTSTLDRKNSSYYNNIESDISGYSYGIQNTSALLSIVYRY